jgi:dienelactone hydrolase
VAWWQRVAFAAVAMLLVPKAAPAQEASLVSVRSPRGAKQAFILIKPQKPVASVVLFAGGQGNLRLKTATEMGWGRQNFLVRTRERFAAHGFMVAVVDAPSDRRGARGMNAIFRMSKGHAMDIRAVIARLRKEADVPVWLVGTSMGTFSAAGGGAAIRNLGGIVLSSTITRSQPYWKIAGSHPNGVASMRLASVAVPALIMSHKSDACSITPAADAPKLVRALAKSRKVEVEILDGGSPPQSEPCGPMSQHGFLGIEDLAVERIATFIKAGH